VTDYLPTYAAARMLLLAVIYQAVVDARHGHHGARRWLAGPVSAELADLLGIAHMWPPVVAEPVRRKRFKHG